MILSVVFVFFWIFFLGAAFGSFMNVVVWRLPQGTSLSRPASHCPRCGRPIRWRHNVPVVGWLVLRGKCFDCRAPISKRYPIVEFLAGCGFLTIALGAPYDWISDFPFLAWDWGFFLTSLGAGMILLDKNQVPFRLLFPLAALSVWGIFHATTGGYCGLPDAGFSGTGLSEAGFSGAVFPEEGTTAFSWGSGFSGRPGFSWFSGFPAFGTFFLLPGTIWLFLTPLASGKGRRLVGVLTLVLSGIWAVKFLRLASLFWPVS